MSKILAKANLYKNIVFEQSFKWVRFIFQKYNPVDKTSIVNVSGSSTITKKINDIITKFCDPSFVHQTI